MKNRVKIIGIIAIIIAIGFTFSTCKEDEESNPFIGTWEGGVYNYRYEFTDSRIILTSLYDGHIIADSSYSYTKENLYYETLTGLRVNYTYRFEGNDTLILYDESSNVYKRVN